MRVLAMVPNSLGWAPGQRSTIEAWEPLLRSNGIELDYAVFETDALKAALYRRGNYLHKAVEMTRALASRAKTVIRDLRDYDAVYLYREAALAGPELYERLIARKGLPIIYELDDPLHLPYRSEFNGVFSMLKFQGKVARICRLSSAVVANSTMIREFAEQHCDNVWQIPSVVDAERYTYEPKSPNGRVVVGWSGSPSTAPNLAVVQEALVQLQGRLDFDLKLIGADHFDLPGLRFRSQPWRAETEVDDLREIDIGLVPLPDVPWNHAKFFLKVAQYMALGIVPVGTPYGSMPLDIQAGLNGFLAGTTEEWVRHISRLVEDAELRGRMSAQAARDAAERYTVQANADRIVGLFRSVADHRR